MTIKGRHEIREAYRDDRVAFGYLDRRFSRPLGALLHARQTALVRRLLRREQPQRVLELAPGPARLSADLTPFLPRGGILLDASMEMLTVARRRLGAAGPSGSIGSSGGWILVQGDAFALAFKPGFDLVMSFRFIRHLEVDDRRRVYSEIRRVLRPGGFFVFDAVNEAVSADLRAGAEPGRYPVFDWLTGPRRLRSELDEAGFEGVELRGVQNRYRLLRALQNFVGPHSRLLARTGMEVVDRLGRLGRAAPIEWVVTCRRG